MGKLDGKTALIAGGTGGVGEGIIRAFLNEGSQHGERHDYSTQ